MKPNPSPDPLDDLIAAALNGDLTPTERTQFETRLQTDPAARAAYQESQLMHDLLEKTHREAQPDPAFEQRMVSGIRRKLESRPAYKETSWESVLVLWGATKGLLRGGRLTQVAVVLGLVAILAGVSLKWGNSRVESHFATISGDIVHAQKKGGMIASADNGITNSSIRPSDEFQSMLADNSKATPTLYPEAKTKREEYLKKHLKIVQSENIPGRGSDKKAAGRMDMLLASDSSSGPMASRSHAVDKDVTAATQIPNDQIAQFNASNSASAWPESTDATKRIAGEPTALEKKIAVASSTVSAPPAAASPAPATPPAQAEQPNDPSRKLIRNANLDMEVKSFQSTIDQITTLTKAAGGYVDTSNSQKGGNGKLQGTIVVKVLPPNLDAFLLKLRDLGQIKNQSISTDDVTKAYFDTQARLENARKMEIQLQELLKRNNGKVSELLQVERELGRVRGDIEQMQGELKLYDFQVQYATVTMQVREADLHQAAAYLLKETDDFALYATDVEGTFQQARHAADDFKGHILMANLNHNSGSNVSATLVVSVPPDQIEAFLNQVRTMGRIDNFTRQTQRVAQDGGDSDQPADQALTEKDKVTVNLSIRSDDESRKQVAMTVVTPAVDTALDKAKTAALANPGVEILSSSLNKTPQGQSTGQLSVRVPGKSYHALLDAFNALGRTASFSLQRDDNSGPGATGDDAPVIISLSLTDVETPQQQTNLSVVVSDVDGHVQQLKRDAVAGGAVVKVSTFDRQPDGREQSFMVFYVPMPRYQAFVEMLKNVGKVESLSVSRQDHPDQSDSNDTAPVEIRLNLHNQGDIVPDNTGLWATLRQTFGEGISALFGSIRTIGVIIAFIIPWVISLALVAWIARRIYIARKK